MLEALTVKENYSLDQTIAKDIFNGVTYPWEVLPKISSFILELGATLSEDEYEKRGENVWVAKSAKVAPTAFINGPAIIGKDAEVRHCAFIRGNAIVLSLIHISEPTRRTPISYAVFCLKKKKTMTLIHILTNRIQ